MASDPPAINWPKELDKRRPEQTVPIPGSLANDIRASRAKLNTFRDDWLCPQSVGNEPWHRYRLDALIRRAEAKANVEKLDGGLWHA